MKIQMAIILVIVALGLGVLGGMQLISPVQPTTVAHVDTLKMSGDTTTLQATVYRTTRVSIRDTVRDTLRDTVLREVASPLPQGTIDQLAGLYASTDTSIDRTLSLNGIPIPFKDKARIEYYMPPENYFKVVYEPITIVRPDTTICDQTSTRPFWIDAAVAVGSGVLALIINALTK